MSDAQARRRPAWGALGDELRRLRRLAGIDQGQIAEVVGVHRSTVERIETGGAHGGSPPSMQVVLDWAAACEVANPDLTALRALAEAALNEHRPYRKWGTLATIQAAIKADEATAMTLRNFNSWGVPGLLQTGRYARALLGMKDSRHLGQVAEATAIRAQRQEILDQPGRRFEFILTEDGLRTPVGNAAIMRAQLQHLAEAAEEPAVTVHVIPLGAWLEVSKTVGFVLYEDREGDAPPFAAIELPDQRVEMHEMASVTFYQEIYAALRAGAASGDEAMSLIHAIGKGF